MQYEIIPDSRPENRDPHPFGIMCTAFGFGIIVLATNLLISLLYSPFYHRYLETAPEWAQALGDIVVYLCLLLPGSLFLCLVYRENPKTEWRQAPSVPRLPFLFLPMAIGAGYLCSDLFSRIFGSVLERFSQSAGAESYYRHPAAVALYFVNICILAPLLEEFLYRGILLKHLLPLGEPTAVLVSALVFGFAHISLSQTIFAFAVGIALGIARTRSGSIWFGVLIHFTANLFSFGVSYWGFVFEEPWATPVTNAIYMLLIGAAIAGSVVYFVRSIVMIASTRRRGEVRTPEENKTSGWKWFFGNPLLYVFAAFYIALLFIYYRA